MKDVSRTRENYKRRTEEIEANQRIQIEESIIQAEAAETRRLNRLENYSKKIIYFSLWQSEGEVESGLNEVSSKTQKLEALKAQLNFRRYVLKQNPKENCYQLSTAESGVKWKLTVDEIKANVIKLVNHAFTIQPVNDSTEDQPILTGKMVEDCFGEDGENKW